MSFTLVLNSSNVQNTSTNTTFKYNFIQGGFQVKDMEMCVSSITLPYSFYNVSSYYANRTFSLIFPTAATTTTISVTLPEGFYSVTDINSYIQQVCINYGAYLIDSTGNYVYYQQLVYNTTYYSVQLLLFSVPTTLPTGYSYASAGSSGSVYTSAIKLPTTAYTPQFVVASTGSIATIIGFKSGATFPSAQSILNQSILSTLTPVGSTINSLIMQCSLVNNPVTTPSDILDSMPISNTSFGSNITYDPSFEKFIILSNGTFNNFTFSFRDQNLNEIYAKDPNVSITLIIRKKKKCLEINFIFNKISHVNIYNGKTSHSYWVRI